MKDKFIKHLVLASAGIFFCTGLTVFADAQLFKESTQITQPDSKFDLIAPASDQAQFKRASELIGAAVRNQQDEKIGAVKDLMVDLQSGRAPFAVVSSGGFFGVGDRLMAVPISTFAQPMDKNELVLNMDRERIKSAPSFDKSSWPDMTDQTWNSQVYSFYGAQPYWQSSATASTSQTTINEPAGAELSTHRSAAEIYPQTYGETESGLSPDRTPRKGLGAADLTRNEQRINNPEGYAASDVLIQEPAGAETRSTTTTTQIDKVKRASELMGMEVKNAQNEHIGKIKDLVIDLQSGRVAYTVLEAGGLLEVDKLYAVPPSVFTRSTDEHWLVFNTDKETLKSAPGFEKNNWPQANNQKFTTEVYRFYHQQPYWQTSGEIREPSGSERKMKLNNKDNGDSSGQFQKGTYNQPSQEQGEINEPSGAALPLTPSSGAEIKESTQTEPERTQSPPLGSPKGLENQTQSSAAKETSELQNQNNPVQEPAGATTESTAKATSEDQAPSDADRQLIKQVKTTLQTDTVLSTEAQNVKVSAANGKITLRGTVSTEQQKQSIAAKAQQIAGSADKVDNQLQVKSDATNPETKTPDNNP